MNILVISQYYFPEEFRINDICDKLVACGNSVTVVTGRPNYPKGEIFEGYKSGSKDSDIINGVKIIRCACRPRHKGTFNLVLNYLSYVRHANKIVKKINDKFDVVYVYGLSPITSAVPAIKYKKKTGVPIYLYCLDLWPESVRELRNDRILSTSHPIYIIAKIISRRIYNSCDKIGVKCTQFSDYLHNVCGVKKEKIELLYEHAEEGYLNVSSAPEDNDCIDFMFLGNIGYTQNCEVLLKALSLVKSSKEYKLHFVGDGSALDQLKRRSEAMGLEDKVIFHGRKSVSEINVYYEMADCCLLTLSCKTACGLTPPAKLVGYMAASRPVLAGAEGATKDIINAAGCGFVTEPDNAESLSEYMQKIIDDPSILKDMGKNGRNYFIDNFTLDKHIDKLIKQLKEL